MWLLLENLKLQAIVASFSIILQAFNSWEVWWAAAISPNPESFLTA
jgi:hypothetical protein